MKGQSGKKDKINFAKKKGSNPSLYESVQAAALGASSIILRR